ncbi:hypothetical protein KGF86_12250 [Ornithinibacillus massiliensis]|uniref:Menaquinol-cytochrome c reductase cytochrome b subunit n=1 Tax=Ornithinibacillus massiliensis TaxID=1944633 RepID=A0ABS5MF75_9BACI|nr:hypothetical protein [Ornithinibacillus massiliensis]MBS3680976.1 hypothetical protein [Ornithinibacillus massiliensis]
MKIIVQSCIFSFVLHLFYIVGTLLVGYFQTKNYQPTIAGNWDTVETLQNEVAFGIVGSPLYFLFTFLGLALVCALILISYRKFVRTK